MEFEPKGQFILFYLVDCLSVIIMVNGNCSTEIMKSLTLRVSDSHLKLLLICYWNEVIRNGILFICYLLYS